MTVPARIVHVSHGDQPHHAGPPWPPSVIEASRRLIMWTIQRQQQAQQQAQAQQE